MADRGHLYELSLAAPARFRAKGLDAAARVERAVGEAVERVLAEHREVLEVEDRAYFRAGTMRCDGTEKCRAGLHYDGCPKRG